MRLVRLENTSPGGILWAYKVYDATNLANPQGTGGLAKDSTYVYSCMTISNPAGSLTQTLIMKFNHASGLLVANRDMNTHNAIGCMAYYFSAATKLLVSITYNTGTT